MTSLLSVEEIQQAIAARQEEEAAMVAEEISATYRFIQPFSTAGDDLVSTIQNSEGRIQMGIKEIDLMTRGFGRGELVYVTGRAHSGKTQAVLHMLCHNRTRRVLYFTPDEVAPLVLAKLVAMQYGINAEEIEQKIKDGNEEMVSLVKRASRHDFQNLIVIDDSLTVTQMAQALQEAEAYWGAECDLVVIDFLELIPGGDDGHDGVVAKSQALKRFSKQANVPVVCLHQASRTSGPRGQAAGMNAMRYGGETEAIFVLEVYRRREDESLDEFERRRQQNTLTIAVQKNKRPPSKKGEVDLFIDPHTGEIRSLRDEDMMVQGVPITSALDAIKVMRNG